MTPTPSIVLPRTEQTLDIARRLIWFETPEQALDHPIRFLAYAFRYGRASDIAQLRNYLSDADFRYALRHAPPGIIDARSWAYWHLMFDLEPEPLPQRRLPSAE